MRTVPAVLLAAALLHLVFAQGPQSAPAIHFVNGQWFDGTGFHPDDFYVKDGLLTRRKPPGPDAATVDLRGGFVIPPYGDAHEHNFDSIERTPAVGAKYLHDGIFYAQGMTDVLEGSRAVVAAGMVNTPVTVDATYAHGALTAPNGHPKEVYESLANGFYYPSTPEQKALVTASHKRDGSAYWEIDSAERLERLWPRIAATKPDLIKIILSGSENFSIKTRNDPPLGAGLDPALVPLITARAHAAGLKVVAHVDTAADYHAALTGGVDEMGHLPGYGLSAADNPLTYRISDEDIVLTAKRAVRVQATASCGLSDRTPEEDLKPRRTLQRDNLSRMKAAGVIVLIGSDRYGEDAVREGAYLQSLDVWSNLELLNMWTGSTPRAIFPRRKIGMLQPGFEASFLVFAINPLQTWPSSAAIQQRWKQGKRIDSPPATPDNLK